MNKNIFKLIARLVALLSPYKRLLFIAIMSILLLAVISPLRPYLIGQLVDNYIIRNQNEEYLLIWVLIIFFSLIVEAILQISSSFYSNLIAQNLILELRKKLFTKIAHLKIKYFDTNPVGSLVTRTVSDMQAITDVFSSGLLDIIRDLLALVLILSLMFFTNWQLAFMTLIPIPILLISTKIFANYMKKAFQKERGAVTALNNFVNERLSGMSLVQLFNRQKEEYLKFTKINAEHRSAHIQTIFANSIFFPVVEFLSSLSIAFILVLASVQASGKGSEEIKNMYGEIVAFTLWISQLYRPIRQLADKFNILQRGAVRAERVFELLDRELEHTDNDEKLQDVSFRKDIYFKEVCFSYNKKEQVLKGLSLIIEQGKTYAIVGSTGSGKTTIINLLCGFYEIDRGELLIGNVPVEKISNRVLNSKIGVVLQDVFLFSGTIRENIILNDKEIDQSIIEGAAKQVGIHDFVEKLPNAYEYIIGERGQDLSTGQRQLISFLRAYINQPDILVLDEATSSVDSESEQLIQSAIEKITADRTSIIIAHRLSTVKKADEIIVMDRGELVEKGTHSELLSNKEGYYYELYSKQFSNGEEI